MTRQHPTLGLFTDYYGVDAANKLLWVNRGTNAPPTAGQTAPYTLYQYDANGRVTQRDRRYLIHGGMRRTLDYSWDGDERLRSVKEGGVDRLTASYDGDGLRVSKWDYLTGQHDYSWGPGGVLHDTNQNTTHTPGWAQRKNGVDRGLTQDYRGTLRFLTESSFAAETDVYRFDAFGGRSDRIGEYYPTPYQFGGAFGYETEGAVQNDQPGLELIYIQQRWYDPAVGRWLTPDPIGLAGGLNLWAYCGGDPVNFVDPSGLQAREVGLMVWRGAQQQWPAVSSAVQRSPLVQGVQHGREVLAAMAHDGAIRYGVPLAIQLGQMYARWSGGAPLALPAGPATPALPRGQVWTAGNFRSNLSKLTGCNPPDAQAHHVLPQEFEPGFRRAGFDIHDPRFGTWWPTATHQRQAAQYNNEWRTFLQRPRTQREILDFARDIMRRYGNPNVNF
jgi:RHS repeat-associated protein